MPAPIAEAQLAYYRCSDPKDKCIALSEAEKSKCPDCRQWYQETLDVSEISDAAEANQQSAGVTMTTVASNYFIAATTKQLYNVDMTNGGLISPPKAGDIYKTPERFGFKELTEAEPKVGSIALFGNLAGIVVQRGGSLQIAYPSATTGAIAFLPAEVLAREKNSIPKYVQLTDAIYGTKRQ